MQAGTIYNTFKVFFYDECNDVTITPPYFADMTTLVYFPKSSALVEAQTDLSCGGFTYSIATPLTDNWPSIDLQAGNVNVYPDTIPTHLGDWFLQIKACLTLTGECKVGPQGKITILNPCLDTRVMGGFINYQMTAPILGTDSMNLAIEMGNQWPFYDTVDNTFPTFAYNCGQILYTILDSAQQPLPQPPIVTRNGDIMTFTPKINDPVG